MHRSQVEYILAVDRLKSFSKAAEACFVTQSTLSTMVSRYEEQIGIVLFDRKTKPVSPTAQGVEILGLLRSVNREFQLLDDGINKIKGQEAGALSIACIPTVAPYLYPLILHPLAEHYPKVTFTIYEYTTERVIEEILAGHVDIGIVSTPLRHKDLIEYPIYRERFLLYDCARRTPRGSYKVADIDIDRLWLLEEGHCLRNQVGKICELRQQKKMNGNITYNCGTIYTLVEMVKQHNGITLLPELALTADHMIHTEHISTLADPVPQREIGLITHKHFIKKRILDTLVDIILKIVTPLLDRPLTDSYTVTPY